MYRLSVNLAFSFPRMNPAAAGCEPGICFLLSGYWFSVFFGGMARQQRLPSVEPSCLPCVPSRVPRDKTRLCLQILRTLTRVSPLVIVPFLSGTWEKLDSQTPSPGFSQVVQCCSGHPEPPLQTRSPARKCSLYVRCKESSPFSSSHFCQDHQGRNVYKYPPRSALYSTFLVGRRWAIPAGLL